MSIIKVSLRLFSFALLSFLLFSYADVANSAIQFARVDPDFDTGSTLSGADVNSLVVDQVDGSIFIGGTFDTFDRSNIGNIAKFNADGTLNTDFNTGLGFNSTVYAISKQLDGEIIVGGKFTSYNGSAVGYLTRLNVDGSIDQSFSDLADTNNYVNYIESLDNGKTLLHGIFTTVNGAPAKYFARLNADGSLDTTLVQGTGFNNNVNAIAGYADGKVIVGGGFTTYKGSAVPRLVRLNEDGTVDSTFNVGTGPNSVVTSLYVEDDGKILVGGYFTSFNAVGANYIVRLNGNGSIDSSFVYGSGFNDMVMDIAKDGDGNYIIGGYFTRYNSVNYIRRIARISNTGTLDTTFVDTSLANSSGFENWVYTVDVDSAGRVYAGGFFKKFNQIGAPIFLRLSNAGDLDNNFVVERFGPDSSVFASAMQVDGKLVIGGWFTNYDNVSAVRIARLNLDGRLDTSFVTGYGFGGTVYDIEALDDGRILVVGDFGSYDVYSAPGIIMLNPNGTVDSSFNVGTGANGAVETVEIASDGKILIGGSFTTYRGSPAVRIARINTNGSLDSTFNTGSGFNQSVKSIRALSDGSVYAGGIFTTFNGASANYIAHLNENGSVDSTFNIGTGFNSWVYDIRPTDDGGVLVGGSFTTYKGLSCARLIKLTETGSVDSAFNPGVGPSSGGSSVQSLLLQADNKVIVTGAFTSYNYLPNRNIVRLNADGSVDDSFDVGNGSNAAISKSHFENDENIIVVVGAFSSFNGATSRNIARVKSPSYHQVDNLDAELDAVHNGLSIKVGTKNAVIDPAAEIELELSSGLPLSEFELDLSMSDADFTGVYGERDYILGKAYVRGLDQASIPQLSATHSLYVPRLDGDNSVYICPDAMTLEEVTLDCAGGVAHILGVSSQLTSVDIEGITYWRIDSLTGTGAISTLTIIEEEPEEEVPVDPPVEEPAPTDPEPTTPPTTTPVTTPVRNVTTNNGTEDSDTDTDVVTDTDVDTDDSDNVDEETEKPDVDVDAGEKTDDDSKDEDKKDSIFAWKTSYSVIVSILLILALLLLFFKRKSRESN